jgi:predicted ATPase/serine/threonine protein kinase
MTDRNHIGRYPIQCELGRGGMGVVYRAHDLVLDRAVAIKVLPRGLTPESRRLQRFLREAKFLAALSHPNIATIYSLEEDAEGARFLVMELVEGRSLKEHLRHGPFPVCDALTIGSQIAAAIEAAHGRGVLHRDLKPENVVITPEELVKVLDFGLGKKVGETGDDGDEFRSARPPDVSTLDADDRLGWKTKTGEIMGTPGYMSPEQAQGREQDRSTDLFSFGCVLYECLAGGKAFGGDSAGQRIEAMLHSEPAWDLLPRETPAPALHLLQRCLEKDPSRRLDHMGEARILIETALASSPNGWQSVYSRPVGDAGVTPGNLPRQLSSFIGRERETAEVSTLLHAVPLLTLTGVGGCGKTRLALRVAGDLVDTHPGGVWLVELASLADPELVRATAAAALGVEEEPGRALDRLLIQRLRGRPTLIILDNCEHILSAAGLLAKTLLRSCPELKILATSREALGIEGETTWRVPSLSCPPDMPPLPPSPFLDATAPPPAPVSAAERALVFEAIQLFVERARSVQPSFCLTDARADAVTRICRRLDGIPLAIELAAAKVKVLSCEEINDRLENCFSLLTGGSRSVLPRHQTLRAAVGWSYSLLSAEEKTLLCNLSVFAGSWTLAAAVALCGEGADELSLLELMGRLVEKSLVQVEEGPLDESRYRMLETVRRFAREELSRREDAADLYTRHLEYFLALAEDGYRHREDPAQRETWLDRLSRAQDDLRAALHWCGGAPDGAEKGLRLCIALRWYWTSRDEKTFAHAAFTEALRRSGGSLAVRAEALRGAGGIASAHDLTVSRSLFEQAIVLFRELNDKRGLARALHGLGRTVAVQGFSQWAYNLLQESTALCREIEDSKGLANALSWAASVQWLAGHTDEARRDLEEALDILRRRNDRMAVADILDELGRMALYLEDDVERAQGLFEESLRLRREAGDRRAVILSLNRLGNAALARGDFARAKAMFNVSLSTNRDLGRRAGTSAAIFNLGHVALEQGDYSEARRLSGMSVAIRRDLEDRPGLLTGLQQAGEAALAVGDIDAARDLYTEASRLSHELGNVINVLWCENLLAFVCEEEGDHLQACELHRHALAIAREANNLDGIAHSLCYLGRSLARMGEHAAARGVFLESLQVHRGMRGRLHCARLLESMTGLAGAMGQPARSAWLWGIARRLRGQLRAPLSPHRAGRIERDLAPARAAMEPERFRQALEAGMALTPEYAMDEIERWLRNDCGDDCGTI